MIDDSAREQKQPDRLQRKPRSVKFIARHLSGENETANAVGGDIIPVGTIPGRALILVIAIMTFLTCIAFGAALILFDAAARWQAQLLDEITIQIPLREGRDMGADITAITDLARQTGGIGVVRLLTEEDSAALLEPWLGTEINLDGLAIPRLLALEIADGDLFDIEAFRQTVSERVSHANIDDHTVWTRQIGRISDLTMIIGLTVFILIGTAMVLSIFFATRAAAAACVNVIEVLHFVGASSEFITGQFQRHFFAFGLKGSLGGAVIAACVFVAIEIIEKISHNVTVMLPSQNALNFGLEIQGYLGMSVIVAVVTGVTVLTSRFGVKTYLTRLG